MTTSLPNSQGTAPRREVQGGAILIVVLMVLVVMALIVMQLSFSMSVNRMIAVNMTEATQLTYMAEGGVEYTFNLLRVDRQRGEYDSLNDSWAEPKPPYDLPYDCKVNVQDESGKINVNMLVTGDGVNIPLKETLERLFLEMDINIEAVHRLADYIDPDSEGDFEDGAINQPLRHLTQLLDIEYITPEVFFSKGQGEEKELGLVDLLTIHSNGRVNVNTAPHKVIMALFNKTEGELGAFDDFRERNVIKDVADLVPLGMVNATEMAPVVGYRSDFFRIIAVAKSERVTRTVECLVVRGARQIEVIERRQF